MLDPERNPATSAGGSGGAAIVRKPKKPTGPGPEQTPPEQAPAQPAEVKKPKRAPVARKPGRPKVEKPTLDLLVVQDPSDLWWRLNTPWGLSADERIRLELRTAKTVGDAMEIFGIYSNVSEFLEEYATALGWEYDEDDRRATCIVDGKEEEVTVATPISGAEIESTSAFTWMMERLLDCIESDDGETVRGVIPDPDDEPRVRGLVKRENWSSPGGGGPDNVYFARGEEGLAALQAYFDDPMSKCQYKVVIKRV